MHSIERAVLIALLTVPSLARAEEPVREPLIEVPTGVIFPASRAQAEAEPQLIAVDETYWTPTAEQVAEAEAKLVPYLEARLARAQALLDSSPPQDPARVGAGIEAPHLRNVLGRLSNAARQYVGLIADGKKWIHIAGMPRDDPFDWRTRYAIVSDGGDWFWEAVYCLDGPDAGFTAFGWHGEA